MHRIAMDVTGRDAPDPRGWTRYARDLWDGLVRLGTVDMVGLDGARWPGPEVAWEQIGLALVLRRTSADAVHAPNCFLPVRRPCAGVVTLHDLAFEAYPEDFARRTRAKYRWLAPRAARSAERVVCVSAFTRDDVCSRYGVDPGRVRVVPNAPSLARGDLLPPEGPYLLGVGDLRAKKNWRRLVTAWRALRAEGLPHRLMLAGADAGEGPALRAAAAGEPLELPGYVPEAELDALMRGAAALVHPSLYEGFGLVVVEAMARGTPVAAARGTALPEAGGDAAVYFDPLDPDAIAAAVLEALQRRDELARLGRERAAHLSWERTARETAAVYAEAVAERAAA